MAFKLVAGYLQSFVDAKDEHTALQSLANLQNVVTQEMSADEQGVCLAELMNSKNSLIGQLNSMMAKMEMDKVRQAIFKFLTEYVDHIGVRVKPFASLILFTCFKFMRADRLNRVKQAAFGPFVTIMKLKLDLMNDPNYTPPSTFIKTLFAELTTSKSKMGQTVRGLILSTLGLMCALHTTDMQPHATKLAGLFMHSLEAELTSKKDVQRQLLENIFKGLRYFLDDFSEQIPKDARKQTERLDYLLSAVKGGMQSKDENRYAVCKAAMALFARHANLFRPYLVGKDAEEILTLLLTASSHANGDVRAAGARALESFLVEITTSLVQRNGAPEKQFFMVLLKFFNSKLENNISVSEVSLAIRAFGHLAKCVMVFMDERELITILNNLLTTSERLYTGPLDEVEKAVDHFPSFISSFALILKELRVVDPSVILYLAQMFGRFFLVFPNLTAKQRARNYQAITRLFVVLHVKGTGFQQLLDKIVYNGLLLTISHLPEDERMINRFIRLPTDRKGYIEYCYLWHNLLGVTDIQPFSKYKKPKQPHFLEWNKGLNYSYSMLEEMQRILFDHLVTDLLKIMKTLDLRLEVRKTDAEAAAARPAAGESKRASDNDEGSVSAQMVQSDLQSQMKPVVPKDFELYLNLVEFFRRFFLMIPSTADQESPLFAVTTLDPVIHHLAAPVGNSVALAASLSVGGSLDSSSSSMTRLVSPAAPGGGAAAAAATSVADSHKKKPRVLSKWFLPWLLIFGKDLIDLSNGHPLVSGFYKMMGVVMAICERHDYFLAIDSNTAQLLASGIKVEMKTGPNGTVVKREVADSIASNSQPGAAAMSSYGSLHGHSLGMMSLLSQSQGGGGSIAHSPGAPFDGRADSSLLGTSAAYPLTVDERNADSADNQRYVWKLYASYLKEVVVRIQQFTDELLFASIQMVLAVPHQFIDIPVLLPALNKSLKIGLNHQPAAILAMDTLDRWAEVLPDLLQPHLPRILPNLSPYIRVPKPATAALPSTSPNDNNDEDDILGDRPEEVKHSDDANAPAIINPADMALVTRILQFLGKVGGQNRHVLGGATSEAELSLAWDTEQHIKYPLAFPNVKLDIYLDPLLPRIAQLAESSSDRRTKVAACEVLHSIVIYMVSVRARDPNRHRPGTTTKSPTALYKRIFPVMLRLACDMELVTKQLFAPLVTQLIHWFTSNREEENKETMALLDAIMDAAASPTDGALRQFAAECVSEYLQWSLKQQYDDNNPINMRAMIRRIYSLAHHPLPYKRLGAALTINQFYRHFRESDESVSLFILDMISQMLLCLQLAERDDASLGTRDEARRVLDNLERIVTDDKAGKYRLLLQENARRQGGEMCRNLETFVDWLFISVGRREETSRRQCMRMFQSFCVLLGPVVPTPSAWVDRYQVRQLGKDVPPLRTARASRKGEAKVEEKKAVPAAVTLPTMVDVFERGVAGAIKLTPPEWLVSFKGTVNRAIDVSRCEQMVEWFDSLATSLDCYYWFTESKLSSHGPRDLLDPQDSDSQLLSRITDFLTKVACSSEMNQWAKTLPSSQYLIYQEKKCTVTIRLFRFMHLVLQLYPKFNELDSIMEPPLYQLLFQSLLDPEAAGFIVSGTRRLRVLQSTIGGLCKCLAKLSSDRRAVMVSVLKGVLAADKTAPHALHVGTLLADAGFSSILVNGYKELWTSDLLALALGAGACKDFAEQLANETFALAVPKTKVLSPLLRHVGHQMLDLSLHVGLPHDLIFRFLSDTTPVVGAPKPEGDGKDAKSDSKRAAPKAKAGVRGRKVEPDSDDEETKELKGASRSNSDVAEIGSTNREQATKGSMFYANFRLLLDSFVVTRWDQYSQPLTRAAFSNKELFTLLLNVSDFVVRQKQRSKIATNTRDIDAYLPELLKQLGAAWTFVNPRKRLPSMEADSELYVLLLDLISKLMTLDEARLIDVGVASSSQSFLLECYLQCVTPKASVSIKKHALMLLPNYLRCSRAADVLKSLRSMTGDAPFPRKSTDLERDSPMWHQYVQLFEQLLKALVLSKSFALMETMLPLLRERDHALKDEISKAARGFVNGINQPGRGVEVKTAVNSSFTIFMNKFLDIDPVDNARRWVVDNVLLPLLRRGPLSVCRDFYLRNGVAVWKLIEDRPNGPTVSKDIEEQQLEMMEMSCAYKLTEILFRRLEKDEIPETKVVHKDVLRIVHTHLKKGGERGNADWLPFRCAAFNCMAQALMTTQTVSKFFDLLAFAEEVKKGEYLWDNIVDLQYKMDLRLDTDFKRIDPMRPDVKIPEFKDKSKYLSSAYLDNSSLSQDVVGMGAAFFDNGKTDLEQMARAARKGGIINADGVIDGEEIKREEKVERTIADDDIIPMELGGDEVVDLDPLNANQTMTAFLRLLDHIYSQFNREWTDHEMPKFMAHMYSKIMNDATHINVKWFIVKLVINRWVIFQRYAPAWFRPLATLCCLPGEQTGAHGFHYLLRDVCWLFLSWHDFVPSDDHLDRDLASRFIAHLMTVAPDHGDSTTGKGSRLKANLVLVKLLVEKWRSRIAINKSVICTHLTAELSTSSRTGGPGQIARSVGLQLLGIIIGNGFHPYDPREDAAIPEEKFCDILLQNLRHKRKDLYEPTAEVWGMILKKHSLDETKSRNKMYKQYDRALRATLKDFYTTNDFQRFLNVMIKIGIHAQGFGFFDRSLTNLIFSIPIKLHAEYVHKALQLIYWGADDIEDIYLKIRPLARRVLTDRDVKSQLMTLMVIHRTLEKLDIENLKELIPDMEAVFVKHNDDQCRALFYKIVVDTYNNHQQYQALPPAAPFRKQLNSALLKGLSDNAPDIRRSLVEFWDTKRLHRDVASRLKECLDELYHPEAEDSWLQYSTFLLLYPARRSTDYDRPFSENPLQECKFDEYTIDPHLISRSQPAFTPLFSVGSLDNMDESADGSRPAGGAADHKLERRAGLIKSTQVAEFSQTPSLMSLSTDELLKHNIKTTSQSQNMLFRPPDQNDDEIPSGSLAAFNKYHFAKRDAREARKRGEHREPIKAVRADGLQRRFAKQRLDSSFYSKGWDVRHRYNAQWAARLTQEGSQKVSLFRKYRKGELPDIQIRHRELLQPLQALHTDPVIAKHLFVMLFKGIYTELVKGPNKERDETRELRLAVQQRMRELLSGADYGKTSSAFVFCLHVCTIEGGKLDPEFSAAMTKRNISAIGEAAFQTRNYHSGVLLLEHLLSLWQKTQATQEVKPPVVKRRREEKDPKDEKTPAAKQNENETVLQLARLYRELDEDDIVMGLFRKWGQTSQTKQGIELYMSGDYGAAEKVYTSALTADDEQDYNKFGGIIPAIAETEFWEDERVECLHMLTDWGLVYDNAMEQVGHQPDDFWKPDEIRYLRHFVASSVKLQEKRDSVLFPFVEKAMNTEKHRSLLEAKYSNDLVLLYAGRGDSPRANYYLTASYNSFLDQWSQLPLLAKGPRMRLLQQLQKLTEVGEFLNVHPSTSDAAKAKTSSGAAGALNYRVLGIQIDRLLHQWENRYPARHDTVQIWDDVVRNRDFYLRQLFVSLTEEKVGAKRLELTRVAELRAAISRAAVASYRNAAHVMSRRGNHFAARKYIDLGEAFHQHLGRATPEADYFLLELEANKVSFMVTQTKSPERKLLQKYLDDLLKLDDKLFDDGKHIKDPFKVYASNGMQADVNWAMADMLANSGQSRDEKESREKYAEAIELQQDTVIDFNELMASDDKKRKYTKDMPRLLRTYAKAHLRVATFTQRRLADIEEKKLDTKAKEQKDVAGWSSEEQTTLIVPFIESVFGAMRLGSSRARYLVPRVMELVSQCPRDSKARHCWLSGSGGVCDQNGRVKEMAQCKCKGAQALLPSWMFIQWMPQMLAALSEPAGALYHRILVRVANEYPQAVYYPFQLSSEYIGTLDNAPAHAVAAVNEIRACLKDLRLVEKVVDGLDTLLSPDLRWKDTSSAIIRALQINSAKAIADAVHEYQEFYWMALANKRDLGGKKQNFIEKQYIGSHNRAWARTFAAKFDEKFGVDGSKISKMNYTKFHTESQSLTSLPNWITSKSNATHEVELRKTCEWLSRFEEFNGHSATEYVEIPGQYSGMVQPQPENHAKVVSFGPTLLVMGSLRKPKRIIMHANDEKDYMWLVKGGEDLRLDQRIEQLFGTMNRILADDARCAKRGLTLRTYNVIPMTTHVGLIEWVPGTTPLKGVISEQDKRLSALHAGSGHVGLKEAQDAYTNNVYKLSGTKHNTVPHISHSFIKLLEIGAEEEVCAAYNDVAKLIPDDLLTRGIAALCSSPESWLVVRSKFARSYAVFTICSYVLGIGDRHLDNFLLDTTDGSLVGIDFGCAFGQGVHLGVPELMPFRMTRQFRALFQPLDTDALLKGDMVWALTALQRRKEMLLTVMDVFVKEPQLDWITAAKAQTGNSESKQSMSLTQGDVSWYPLQKLKIARRKLNRHNPSLIMVEEISGAPLRYKHPRVLEKCLLHIKGAPGRSQRARAPPICTSVSMQVDLLVEQATDINILGRTWSGWWPFV